MENNMRETVNKLVKWDKLMKEGKKEQSKLKAELQNVAVLELENSKKKQIKYYGNEGNTVVVTMAEKVEMISRAYLREAITKNILEEFMKTETKYTLNDKFKKIVGPILSGNYSEQKVEDVISEMGLDMKKGKLARKKLKGVYDKDIDFLVSIGMTKENAGEYAFFISEAFAWERVVKLLEVAGHVQGTDNFKAAIKGIKQALIVEETLKIEIKYEEQE
ncbi:MAG: hypothetical protein COA82_06730 [Alkaliphilus sp.]|nr:MAG: hypothetical protein COA82_06730 [Alkaliphilus sp.]